MKKKIIEKIREFQYRFIKYFFKYACDRIYWEAYTKGQYNPVAWWRTKHDNDWSCFGLCKAPEHHMIHGVSATYTTSKGWNSYERY